MSVSIKGEFTGLFESDPPAVCVELRARGVSISHPVSASYGFDEANSSAQLLLNKDNTRIVETNTITLMIADEPKQKTVTLHLLDVATGLELAKRESIEVAISF